ncbi:hypothetical protein [Mesorhizobium sp. LjNodule214]|uniref:hypothetical protein n=1 Tax=Mesorhizobium sp. LjNodule214 TaxID=3342252 RepID=UPI003ED077D5
MAAGSKPAAMPKQMPGTVADDCFVEAPTYFDFENSAALQTFFDACLVSILVLRRRQS